MINGLNIFYYTSKGRGFEPVQTKGKGFEPLQTKEGGSCNKKCNRKSYKKFRGSALKISN